MAREKSDDPEDKTTEDIIVTAPPPVSDITKLKPENHPAKHHTPIPSSETWENGGQTCSRCKTIVPHDDLLGYWDASAVVFTVVGYYCSKCENRHLMKKYVSEERKQTGKYRTMSGWEKAFWRSG